MSKETEVTDQVLIDKLNAPAPSSATEVTDQALINQLNGTSYNGTEVEPSQLKSGDQLGGQVWDGTQFVEPSVYSKPKPPVEDIYNSKRAAIRNPTAVLGQTDPHQGSTHTTSGSQFSDTDTQNELLARSKGANEHVRYQMVKAAPWYDKMAVGAGRELDSLASGVNNLGYGVAGTIADIWHQEHPSLVGGDVATNMFDRMMEEDRTHAIKNEVMSQFDANKGAGGNIGAMLPYLISGRGAGPLINKAAETLAGGLLEGPVAVAGSARGAITKLVDRMAASNKTPIKNIGGQIKDEITDPLANWSSAMKLRPTIKNPYTEGMVGDVLGGTTLGGLESAIHPDQDWWEGALSSGAGSLAGVMAKPFVANMPDFRAGNETEKDLLDWGWRQGMRFLPGMETGSKRLQKFEHAMRSDSQLGDSLALHDNSNAIVNNRIAANAMGMKGADQLNGLSLTPKELTAHFDDIGKQYDMLEAGTVAHFRPQDINNIRGLATKTIADKTIDASIGKLVKGYADKIMAMAPSRNPLTGKIMPSVLGGDNYKEIRRNLRSDINDAYAKSDTRKAEALAPLLQHVDDAVERGVGAKGGTATVAEWKDLNERYAMTSLIIEHGMTPTGQFAPERILNHLMGSDTKRLLTDQGGRIKDLQQAAKIAYMDKVQEGSDLSGMGVRNISNAGNPNLVEKLLMTGHAGWVPALPRMALAAYTKLGYPAKTGLLNMSGKGYGNPSLYTRALQQAVQPYPEAIDYGAGQGRAVKKKMTEAEKWFSEKYGHEDQL